MRKLKILYYISSHGYGHAARAGQVIRELVKSHDVTIKTSAPAWLLNTVIGKTLPIYPGKFDIGCVQGNNMDIDEKKTISAYAALSKVNYSNMNSELSFIQGEKFDLIVSDIPPFPFELAKICSIPSVFVGNFTWKGIYESFITEKNHPVIKELESQYKLATLSLVTPLAMNMPELLHIKKISLIARKGINIRARLNHELNIPSDTKLVFVYPGNLGFENVSSEQVQKSEGYFFISFYPLTTEVTNFFHIPVGSYKHEDIMASSDIALIKPGYGMISEALVNEKPIIYPPREDFSEYFAFTDEFAFSGGTVRIDRDDYEKGNWGKALNEIKSVHYKKSYAATGAAECKKEIENLF